MDSPVHRAKKTERPRIPPSGEKLMRITRDKGYIPFHIQAEPGVPVSAHSNIRAEIYVKIDVCFFCDPSQKGSLVLNWMTHKIRQPEFATRSTRKLVLPLGRGPDGHRVRRQTCSYLSQLISGSLPAKLVMRNHALLQGCMSLAPPVKLSGVPESSFRGGSSRRPWRGFVEAAGCIMTMRFCPSP